MPIAPAPATLGSILAEALAAASEHADAVDRDARFPTEAVDALRRAGALGAYVPLEEGGLGSSFEDLADATYRLSQRC
jgi:acyl-CoA dehydrogenase